MSVFLLNTSLPTTDGDMGMWGDGDVVMWDVVMW
jgi:hypothetical protein